MMSRRFRLGDAAGEAGVPYGPNKEPAGQHAEAPG
jgi:hypothetical protein